MTTTDIDLDLRIRTFKASSSFTPGDACSFSIDFGEDVTLPGRHDPSAYLRRLGVDVTGKNVLVVCPGNAGLAVAALRAGASTVAVLEPRPVYHRAIPEVSTFASEVIGATFSQREIDDELVEAFDVVFWSEGLDEVSHPKSLVQKVLASMLQGSTLYLEVNHGHNGKLPESINAWRPTAAAFKETLEDLGDLEVITELEGRSQTRKIYKIKNNTVRAEVLGGPDYQSADDVQDFAEKIKEEIQKNREDVGQKIEPFVSKEFIQKKILDLSDEEIEEVKKLDKERDELAARRVAEKFQDLDQRAQKAVDDYASAASSEEKVEALDAAVKALTKKVGVLQGSKLLPDASKKAKGLAAKVTSLITGQEEGELDSIYEGRASTPKSKKKKTRGRGRGGSSKPKS
jgi:predicted transcriptional regulator